MPCINETVENQRFATAGGFGAILLWSMTVAVARSLSEQVGSVTAAAAVCSVGGVVALLRSGRRCRQILQLPSRYLIGCGTFSTDHRSGSASDLLLP